MNNKKELISSNELVANADLKKHSALTTFKTSGKRLPLSVSKAVQAIYAKEQNILRESFRKNALVYIKDIFSESDVENIMNNLYNNKSLEFSDKNINENKLKKLTLKFLETKLHSINWEILDKKTREYTFEELNNNILTQLAIKNCEPLDDLVMEYINAKNIALGISDKQYTLDTSKPRSTELKTDEQLNELLFEIKNFCKEIAIKKSAGPQQLDYSILTKVLGVNSTRFKNDMKKAVETNFEFNFINKKNLNVDIKAAMLSSIKFVEGPNVTFLEYEIPTSILKFLLLPEAFIDLKEGITYKITNDYAYDLYQFLKDHILKGEVTITKQELVDFLNLPKKAIQSKFELQNRVLIPSIADLELVTDISVTYELIPENKFKQIKFIIKRNRNYKEPEKDLRAIRKAKEVKKDYKDSQRILKAIEKAKRNIYVSRSMKKFVYTKINKMYNEFGEDFVVFILNELYTSLNNNIETTLVQYINGMIKNLKTEARENKKRLTKKKLDETLKKKISEINEDIIPTFKNEQDANTYIENISQYLFKIQITKVEKMKLEIELKKIGKSENFINLIIERYFEIVD